jgi:hypothetical protein
MRPPFMRVQPSPVDTRPEGLVCQAPADPRSDYPLVITPRVSGVHLPGWLRLKRDDARSLLAKHGALLFRGFDVTTPEALQAVAAELHDQAYVPTGEHPSLDDAGSLYTPVRHAADVSIPSHNENSHLDCWPIKITFCCVIAPASGGVTTLADSAAVLRRLSSDLVNRVAEHGILYQRVFGGGLGLSWEEAFRSADRAAVERRCGTSGYEYQWLAGNRLRIRWRRPGLVMHPASGIRVWFNQVTHFHTRMLAADLRGMLSSLLPADELPRNCWFGDSQPISDDMVDEIREAYAASELGVPWQAGDVLTVDNMRLAHARTPYTGERSLLIALGEPSDTRRNWWNLEP